MVKHADRFSNRIAKRIAKRTRASVDPRRARLYAGVDERSCPDRELPMTDTNPLSLRDLQALIKQMYGAKDVARGVDGTFMWLMEEVGELAAALREGTPEELALEFADVLAWLATIANVAGVDLDAAVRKKYGSGCPGCGQFLCQCDISEKPY